METCREYKNLKTFYTKAEEYLVSISLLNQKESINYVRNKFNKEILNNYYYIGSLNKKCKKLLNARFSTIKFSMDSLLKNKINHPDLKFYDYEKINEIVRNYDELFTDRKGNLRFFKNVNNKLYEIVVKTTQDGKENYLTTFHRCDESKIRKLKKIV